MIGDRRSTRRTQGTILRQLPGAARTGWSAQELHNSQLPAQIVSFSPSFVALSPVSLLAPVSRVIYRPPPTAHTVAMAAILCLLAAASLVNASPVDKRQTSATATGTASATVPDYFQTSPEIFPRPFTLPMYLSSMTDTD